MVLATGLIGADAFGTAIRAVTTQELITKSEVIFKGTVTWRVSHSLESSQTIITRVAFAVDELLKAPVGVSGPLVLEFLGGPTPRAQLPAGGAGNPSGG